MNCPVCEFSDIEKREGTVCPRCGTDLSALLHLEELPDVYYNKAVHLIEEGKLEKAREMLNTSLGLKPNHINSHILCGKICAEMRDYDEAIYHWNEALKLGADDTNAIEEDIRKVQILKEEDKRREEERVKIIRKKEGQKVRARWMGYSIAATLVAVVIGLFLPYQPLQKSKTVITQELVTPTPTIAPKVKVLLQSHGITEIEVEESDKIIYLKGKVRTLFERYELEKITKNVEGIQGIDIRGVDVIYPNGWLYRVKKGDTLWDIARRVYGDGDELKKIHQANKEIISDPSEISPGLILLIPG